MLRNKWYLVGEAEKLKKDRCIKIMILGEPLVVFRGENGAPTALEDRCCHRNVPLSLGSMSNGCVVCPYHGWTFDEKGICVSIPSLAKGDKIPRSAKVKQYLVEEQNKLLWIFMGEQEEAKKCAPPPIPEMDVWPFVMKEHIFEADLEAAAESLLDPYHIAFTHRHSIGTLLGSIEGLDRNPDFHIQIIEDGLIGSYGRENVGSWLEQQYFGEKNVEVHYRFFYPSLSRLEARFKDRVLLILEHIMQVDEKRVSMTQITLWKNIFSPFNLFARLFMQQKSNKIVQEDIELLKAQRGCMERMKAKEGQIREVSVKGDAISLAFRKYWRRQQREKVDFEEGLTEDMPEQSNEKDVEDQFSGTDAAMLAQKHPKASLPREL